METTEVPSRQRPEWGMAVIILKMHPPHTQHLLKYNHQTNLILTLDVELHSHKVYQYRQP